MAGMQPDAEVLKEDVSGRRRTSPERRNQLLDEFEGSGLSGPKFASLVGVKYPTFAAWVLRRKRERQRTGSSTPVTPTRSGGLRWLEAVVEGDSRAGSPPGGALVIELPGGGRMHVADARHVELAVALLRNLQRPC